MKKRIVALLTVLLLICGSVSAYATPTITPKGIACVCGGNTATTNIEYGPWVLTGKTRDCIHDKYGTDAERSRRVTYSYKCTKCGMLSYRDVTQKEWVCRGYTT